MASKGMIITMARSSLALVLATIFALASSCMILDGSFDDSRITSFGFSRASNPGLKKGRRAKVLDESPEIIISIPDYLDASALAPDFEFKGVKVLVDGHEQISGVTKNDFTKSLVYSVLGMDDETTDYRITVSTVPPYNEKDFWFNIYENASYRWDYDTVHSNRCNLPWYSSYDITRLNIRPFTYGVNVMVDDTVLAFVDQDRWSSDETDEASIPLTVMDFTNPVEFIVTAEDGSTASYVVTLTKKPYLINFAFKASANPGLLSDCVGSIDETAATVDIEVPDCMDLKSLIAYFYYEGDSVSIGGVKQTSQASVNDFSGDVVYSIDGGSYCDDAEYRVRASIVPSSSEKELLSITIGKITLKEYGDTYSWGTRSFELVHTFPNDAYLNLDHLYVLPRIKGLRISVQEDGALRDLHLDDGTNHTYPSNFVDFTSQVTFVITAQDGSTLELVADISKEAR